MTLSDYRKMLYFNNFARQYMQGILVILSWFVSVVVLLLERFSIIGQLEGVTHACLLLVSVVLPCLVATAEFSVYRFWRYKKDELTVLRTITFSDTGIELAQEGRKDTIFEEWKVFHYIFETKSLLILYRTAGQLTLLPKRVVSNEQRVILRELFKTKMQRAFIQR